MKIRMSQLSPAGISIKDDIPPDSVNERLKISDGGDIKAISPLKTELKLEPAWQGGTLRGTVSCVIGQPCARCGDEKEHTIKADVDFACKPSVTGDESEDFGLTYYHDDFLYTEPLCEEMLLLQISSFWKPECISGKCRLCDRPCGESRQSEAKGHTLGGLLVKAVKKKQDVN